MSLEIIGLGRDSTAKYREMKTVWEACLDARVEPPAEVLAYLDVANRQETWIADAVTMRDGGIEIDIGKLPSQVHIVRITETVGP
jgi:hypothetical protein